MSRAARLSLFAAFASALAGAPAFAADAPIPDYDRGTIYRDLERDARPAAAETPRARMGLAVSSYFPSDYGDAGFDRTFPWLEASILQPISRDGAFAIRGAVGGMAMRAPTTVALNGGGTYADERSALLLSPSVGVEWAPFARSGLRGPRLSADAEVGVLFLGRAAGLDPETDARVGVFRLTAGYVLSDRWFASVARTFGTGDAAELAGYSAGLEFRL